MDHAILSLTVSAHKAEQLANIFHADGEDDAAHAQRQIAEDCRHGLEILRKRRADWLAAFNQLAIPSGNGPEIEFDDELRDLYRDGLNADEAFQAWLEEQPVNDP